MDTGPQTAAAGELGAGLQPEGRWPIVGERNLHMGAELAALDVRVLAQRRFEQCVEKPTTEFGCCRRGKPGAQAMAGVRRQSKLRHQQQAASDLLQTKVHFAGIVFENTIFQYFSKKLLTCFPRISGLHPDENKQTRANLADDAAGDADFSSRDALQQPYHWIATFRDNWVNCGPRGSYGQWI